MNESELHCIPSILNGIFERKDSNIHGHTLVDMVLVVTSKGSRLDAELGTHLDWAYSNQPSKPLLVVMNE